MKTDRRLDHVALVVRDTEEALAIWRDRFGFPLLFSEVVAEGRLRLTHLDLGNTQLQLVQPLQPNHPLWDWLQSNGPGWHHICLSVHDVAVASQMNGLVPGEPKPHQGTQGKLALFLDQACTGGVPVELTSRAPRDGKRAE